jgi:hypothetical protein
MILWELLKWTSAQVLENQALIRVCYHIGKQHTCPKTDSKSPGKGTSHQGHLRRKQGLLLLWLRAEDYQEVDCLKEVRAELGNAVHLPLPVIILGLFMKP